MSGDTSSIWRRLSTPLIYVAVLLVLVTGMFVVVAQASGPARSEPAGTIATGEVDGRSVAVVVYKADTMGHLDIFRLEAAGFSTQAEAFDLVTGDRIWDTMLMTEFGGTDAEVLGMGSDYVYVRSAKGLLILDAATGEIVAREAEIGGLGDDYIASFDAYAWDALANGVVLLDANGAVLSIPAGALEAEPADASVVERWVRVLNIDDDYPSAFDPSYWEQVESRAPVPGGGRIDPTWAAAGWDVDVLLDADTGFAAGWPYGFAVTQTYQPASRGDAPYAIEAGDLSSQELLGSVEVQTGVSFVVDDGRGHVVMLAGGDDNRGRLVIATADGIRSSIIGERGFFGQ
ncbi:PA2928 family protein [Microbacterium sp. AGC85]